MPVLLHHFRVPRVARVRVADAMLERLQLMQHLIAVECLDVPRLNWREAAHGPAEMYEVRLDRIRERMHPDLFGQTVALARIAGAARRDDVGPIVRAAA